MFKVAIIIFLFFFLSACSEGTDYSDVQIIWKEQWNNSLKIKWRGVMFDDGSVLTSAHVVSDDRINYTIEGKEYFTIERDVWGDRAILIQSGIQTIYSLNMFPKKIHTGSIVSTKVIRSWSVSLLTWSVLFPHKSIVGYDSFGRVVELNWLVLTDMDLISWDSGAGIYAENGELIDVVHVK